MKGSVIVSPYRKGNKDGRIFSPTHYGNNHSFRNDTKQRRETLATLTGEKYQYH